MILKALVFGCHKKLCFADLPLGIFHSAIFSFRNGSFGPNNIVLGNIINVIFMYFLVSFIVQNQKKRKKCYSKPRVLMALNIWTKNYPLS